MQTSPWISSSRSRCSCNRCRDPYEEHWCILFFFWLQIKSEFTLTKFQAGPWILREISVQIWRWIDLLSIMSNGKNLFGLRGSRRHHWTMLQTLFTLVPFKQSYSLPTVPATLEWSSAIKSWNTWPDPFC